MPQGHTLLGLIHFWGPMWGALSSACRKRKCCLPIKWKSLFLVAGLFSGVIKVFNAQTGAAIATLDPDSLDDKEDAGNDTTAAGGCGSGYPISRIRCNLLTHSPVIQSKGINFTLMSNE